MTDVESLAVKTLEERRDREIAREIARLVAKEQVSREIEQQSSKTAGDLARTGFMLIESADIRNWQTLPAKLGGVRLYLPPGDYHITVQFLDEGNGLLEESIIGQVEIKSGQKTFVLSRSVL